MVAGGDGFGERRTETQRVWGLASGLAVAVPGDALLDADRASAMGMQRVAGDGDG
jgi:hypothetical protein